jgi:hypothetical protein
VQGAHRTVGEFKGAEVSLELANIAMSTLHLFCIELTAARGAVCLAAVITPQVLLHLWMLTVMHKAAHSCAQDMHSNPCWLLQSSPSCSSMATQASSWLDTPAGVRARQEKVPFAILDDPSVVTSTLQPLLNQVVALTVTPDTVSIDKASQAQINLAATTAAASGAVVAAATDTIDVGAAAGVSKVSTSRLLQLLDCTPSLAGAKASACAKLEQVRRLGAAVVLAVVLHQLHEAVEPTQRGSELAVHGY